MARRIYLRTFGCQMNRLDTELVAGALRRAGHELVADEGAADTVLLNTCAVRDQAENRVRSALGLLRERKRTEPDLVIGVLGCMAQRSGASLRRWCPEIDLVAGPGMVDRIDELLAAAQTGPVVATDARAPEGLCGLSAARSPRGPQAFVAAMRGCDNFCAYCVVPYVRGRARSRPLADILAEMRALLDRGVREVTLLGQSIDAWGRDLRPRQGLVDLVRAAGAVDGLARLRFLTAHPRNVDRDLFAAMAEAPAVCEHLHMPAQSGADPVLRAMGRGYTRAAYDKRLAWGRELVPGMAFSSDFVVGFPGETEAQFCDTLALVERARFQNIFAFRYSPRPGTAAARRPDDVPHEAKEGRLQALLSAQEAVSRARNTALHGTVQTVLVEGPSARDPHNLTGRTRHNAVAVFPAPADPVRRAALTGREVTLRITGSTPLTLFGEPVSEDI